VWSIRAAGQFSANELNRDHRALCLLLERPPPSRTATAFAELCVRHPGSRQHPTVFYRPVTRDGALGGHPIAALVTRADDEQLTASFLPRSVGAGYRSLRWQVLSASIGRSCTTAALARLRCGLRYPPRPAVAQVHPPVPVGCIATGPPFVDGGGPRAGKVVALTFDDGPWVGTPRFLDVLEREQVPATFFQIGDQISSYGAGVDARMLRDGDVIGDHTWDHADVAAGGSIAASEITRTAAAIHSLTGFAPCLFRAPGGAVSPSLISTARALGFTTIQWNVDPRDWSRPGADAIYNRVVSAVSPGSIVVQHDGGGDRSQTLAALPREIDALRARGYRFVTVPELLGLRLTYG
jgi:peptidoglycan/xylan/chitin deacetylase (PgdA/CDA1 family)